MLLRFGVTNHHSIRDGQVLSMMASSLHDDSRSLLAWPSSHDRCVVPVALIYGPNASGKSNFTDAFVYMNAMIRESHSFEPDRPFPSAPFLLEAKARRSPSTFVCDFVHRSVRYSYGFSILSGKVAGEWLHAFPHGRKQVLFSRKGQKFNFYSNRLGGRKKILAELTRPNSLYLSTGSQNAHKTLSIVRSYFGTWAVDRATGDLSSTDISEHVRRAKLSRVIELLQKLDVGVLSFRSKIETVPKEAIEFARSVNELITRNNLPPGMIKELSPKQTVFELGHRGRGGKSIYFSLDKESDGTRRLLPMLSLALDALDTGSLLIVDELSASLHTVAASLILRMFQDPKTNRRGAQLVVTTHDTNLLQEPYLRRDQVWFTEKDKDGATNLYPLTDFHTKRGDNIERGYLQGRYGAIPRPIGTF